MAEAAACRPYRRSIHAIASGTAVSGTQARTATSQHMSIHMFWRNTATSDARPAPSLPPYKAMTCR
ncbi:hypothetical protein [Streptomyces caelestis]|uniref:hypothetical protein n=1 Tax=Streptomyces caelestis TaxID=36816 RepID=UPI00365D34BD